MPKNDNKNNDVLISDSGIIASRKKLHEKIFVTICRVISIFLAIIGLLAFIQGNF